MNAWADELANPPLPALLAIKQAVNEGAPSQGWPPGKPWEADLFAELFATADVAEGM